MKILLISLGVIVLLAAGILLYKHYLTYRVLDKGGMENPDYRVGSGDDHIPDGAYMDAESETVTKDK